MADHLADITAESLRPFLDRPGVTDISIQRPAEVWIDSDGWRCEAAPKLTPIFLRATMDAIANHSRQSSSERRPFLSAELPDGERVQIARPPVSEHPVIVVRKPTHNHWRLAELAAQGVFELASPNANVPVADTIRSAYEQREWQVYLAECVRAKRNILIAGPTGSGKTTMLKALAHEIPADQRIITIEDVREISLPHANAIRLRYSKGGQGAERADARELLEACLRMRPDRILFGELRGSEAFQFLRCVNSGHPGSLTSIHANSPNAAIDQLSLLARQAEQGRGYGVHEMRDFVSGLIDVVVQMEGRRVIAIYDSVLEP